MESYSQRTRIRNNLNAVIQRLNDSLKKYDEMGRTVQLLSDSVFAVKNGNSSLIKVNVLKLNASKTDSFNRGGIGFVPINYQTHVPANWIYFHQPGQTNRLKLEKATEAEARRLYYLFLDMRRYMLALRR